MLSSPGTYSVPPHGSRDFIPGKHKGVTSLRAQPQHRAQRKILQYDDPGQQRGRAWGLFSAFFSNPSRDTSKPEAQKCTQNWRLNMRGVLSCEDLICGGNAPNSQVSPALVPQHNPSVPCAGLRSLLFRGALTCFLRTASSAPAFSKLTC